jgi:hypothetical protein
MGRNPDGSISISTIGDRIDAGQDMSAHCNDCQWSTTLSLEKLAEKLGRDHSALAGDLKHRLKCSRCGSKNMGFTVHTNAGWDGTGGHSLSTKKSPEAG